MLRHLKYTWIFINLSQFLPSHTVLTNNNFYNKISIEWVGSNPILREKKQFLQYTGSTIPIVAHSSPPSLFLHRAYFIFPLIIHSPPRFSCPRLSSRQSRSPMMFGSFGVRLPWPIFGIRNATGASGSGISAGLRYPFGLMNIHRRYPFPPVYCGDNDPMKW